jgi:hypothetical protein
MEEAPPAPTVPISTDALRTFVGTYDNPQTGPRAVVTLQGDELVISVGDRAHRLRHVGARSFEAVDDSGVAVAFVGRGGMVERIQYRQGDTGAVLMPVDLELEAAAEAEGGGAGAGDATPAAPDPDRLPRGEPINWGSFRGAQASGNGDGQGVPTSWDVETGENVRWRTPIPGIANSSPVIWGERVFVTTAISGAGDETVRTGLYGDTTPVDDLSRTPSASTRSTRRVGRSCGSASSTTGRRSPSATPSRARPIPRRCSTASAWWWCSAPSAGSRASITTATCCGRTTSACSIPAGSSTRPTSGAMAARRSSTRTP